MSTRRAGPTIPGMPPSAADLAWDDGPLDGSDAPPRARAREWLAATPAEVRGAAVLLALALAATAWFGLGALRRDRADPPPVDLTDAAGVGPTVGADGTLAPGAPTGPPGTLPDLAAGEVDASVGPVVHVTGAVLRPGLVRLAPGARVGDAVEAAGGLTADADPVRVNLARPVSDGEQVHVLRVGEVPPDLAAPVGSSAGAGGAAGATGGTTADGRIDLNRATADELTALPGIGPAKAAAIVAHRERNGPFAAPGDVRQVTGIGEATFQRIADLITVS